MGAHSFKLVVLGLVIAAVVGSVSLFPTVLLLVLGGIVGARAGLGRVFFQIANEAANNVAGGFFTIASELLTKVAKIDCEVAGVVPGPIGASNPSQFSVHDLIKPPPRGKVTIVISNHRTRVDWMLLWIVFARANGVLRSLKIVLKDELSKIPLFGWAMQHFRFIFLARSWQTDQQRMSNAVSYYKCFGESVVLLIFPEGTDLHPAAVTKSNTFAAEKGQRQYTYVLHPRTTGLAALIESLGDSLHEVIDLTMAYEDFVPGERPSEKSFFGGRITNKINVLVQRWKVGKEAPAGWQKNDTCFYWPDRSADGIAKFLHEQFEKKEDRLAQYYVGARGKEGPVSRSFSWMSVGYKLKLAPDANCVPTQDEAWVRMRPALPSFKNAVAIPAMWGFGFIVIGTSVVSSWAMLGLFVVFCAFYTLETLKCGGIDQWLMFPAAAATTPRA